MLRTRAGGDDDGWKTGKGREKERRGGQGRGAQGRARRTRAGAAAKGKATRAAGGEDRRMGTGWVVARTGGEEKDGRPRRKSPPCSIHHRGRQTRAVVRQRPLPGATPGRRQSR